MIVDLASIKSFYINLNKDTNRKKSIEKVLEENKINFERIEGIEKKQKIGCALSHIKALSTVLMKNSWPAMIIEDDAVLRRPIGTVEVPENIDALHVHLGTHGAFFDENPIAQERFLISDKQEKIHRVNNMLNTTAIVYFTPEYAKACISGISNFISNFNYFDGHDVALAQLNPKYKVYALNDPFFYQDNYMKIFTDVSLEDLQYDIIE